VKGLKKPELKKPELKMPGFVTDLYWDLRDRRLLPLVALVLIAIVATPILLGQGSEETPSPDPGAVAALREEGAHASQLTVVEANPGLRDYRKRLRGRTPTDPFRQPPVKQSLKGAQLGGGEGEGEGGSSSTSTSTSTSKSTSTTTTEKETAGSGATGEGSPGRSGGSGGSGEVVEYTIAVDVQITTTRTLPSGKKEKNGPQLRKRVIPPAPLPSADVPAVVFMGLSPKTGQPSFLVSDAVTAIFGEGRCLLGTETCQLLEVDPGMPETFVFGPESTRYKLVALNPRRVPISHEQLP